MKLTRMLAVVSCVTILFIACQKTEDKNNNPSNTTLSAKGQLLVAGKWQVSAYKGTLSYMGKDTTADLFTSMDACEKDNFVLFAENGTATEDENTNACVGQPQITTITWALLNNDTRLALVDSNPDTFDLDITNAEMKLKYIRNNSSGTPVTYVFTYKNIK